MDSRFNNDEVVEIKINLAFGHPPFPSDSEKSKDKEPERAITRRELSEEQLRCSISMLSVCEV